MSNNQSPVYLPDYALDELACALYPSLIAFYQDEANQRAFEEWQVQRKSKQA